MPKIIHTRSWLAALMTPTSSTPMNLRYAFYGFMLFMDDTFYNFLTLALVLIYTVTGLIIIMIYDIIGNFMALR